MASSRTQAEQPWYVIGFAVFLAGAVILVYRLFGAFLGS